MTIAPPVVIEDAQSGSAKFRRRVSILAQKNDSAIVKVEARNKEKS